MDDYFVSSISYCQNKAVSSYIYNVTSPYTDSTNRASIVGTSVAMFTLTTLFFNLNFFSRVSHVSSILNPSVGLIRSAALSLFLPVMSYLFSDAKRPEAGGSGTIGAPEMSLRARLILTWMLLVELLRHRAEAVLASAGVQGYTANVEQAARILWLGNLVFFSIQSPGRRALFGVLWVIAAAKLVRRVVITEFIKRSFAFGRNPDILTAYMVQVLKEQSSAAAAFRRDEEEHQNASSLRSCKFAVTGEEKLEKMTSPHGYRVNMENCVAVVITVGQIWTLAEGNDDELLKSSGPRPKMLSLSFALFKLLRRRLENPLAISTSETRSCRDLIFNGLHSQHSDDNPAADNGSAVGVLEMVNSELNFLSEYYHSVLPVVLACPFFFFANYILFPIMVFFLCAMTVVLCGNGDIPVALYSLKSDNFVTSSGATTVTICLMRKALTSLPALLSAIDLSITLFLFLIYMYEEVWEPLMFILSDWFLVSLLCDYTASRPADGSMVSIFRCAIRCILWVRNRVPPYTLKLRQRDLLGPCLLSLLAPPEVPVPREAKRSIVQYLAQAASGGGLQDGGAESTLRLSNGKSALNATQHSHLSWACESESVAEVILTWHIATRLFEAERKGAVVTEGRKMATSLSRYCAYLVASHPEILPDDRNDTKHLYKVVNSELKQTLGFCSYYCCKESRRCKKLLETARNHAEEEDAMTLTVVEKGVRLGKSLVDEAASDAGGESAVWEVLAALWVELIVYVAPASDEAHVNAHRAALVHGGEFVTLIWALATHTGITRPVVQSTEDLDEQV